MKPRTPEEIKRILRNCLRIEKENGDVLEYLASEHYISPRATWYNLQKYELRRKEIMDGRPRGGHNEKYDKRELIEEILKNRKLGINERKTLMEKGYKNPFEKYQLLKEWAMQHDTELYLRMTDEDPGDTAEDESSVSLEKSDTVGQIPEEAEPKQEETECCDEVEMEAPPEEEGPDRDPGTGDDSICDCHPAQDETKPAKEIPQGLEIVAVKGKAGMWFKSGKYIRFEEFECSIDSWKKIYQELGSVLDLFGRCPE